MGLTESLPEGVKARLKDYKCHPTVNPLGDSILVHKQTSETFLFTKFVCSQYAEHQRHKQELDLRAQLKSQNLCELVIYEPMNEPSVCAQMYAFATVWEYPQAPVTFQFDSRCPSESGEVQGWLWGYLMGLSSALGALEEASIPYGKLRYESLAFNRQCTLKVIDPMLIRRKTNLQEIKSSQTPKNLQLYLSPEEVKINRTASPHSLYNTSKSDVFVGGMMLLSFGLNEQLHTAYTENYTSLDITVLRGAFLKFKSLYSQHLSSIAQLMLRIRPQERPSWRKLYKLIQDYKHFSSSQVRLTDSIRDSKDTIIQPLQALFGAPVAVHHGLGAHKNHGPTEAIKSLNSKVDEPIRLNKSTSKSFIKLGEPPLTDSNMASASGFQSNSKALSQVNRSVLATPQMNLQSELNTRGINLSAPQNYPKIPSLLSRNQSRFKPASEQSKTPNEPIGLGRAASHEKIFSHISGQIDQFKSIVLGGTNSKPNMYYQSQNSSLLTSDYAIKVHTNATYEPHNYQQRPYFQSEVARNGDNYRLQNGKYRQQFGSPVMGIQLTQLAKADSIIFKTDPKQLAPLSFKGPTNPTYQPAIGMHTTTFTSIPLAYPTYESRTQNIGFQINPIGTLGPTLSRVESNHLNSYQPENYLNFNATIPNNHSISNDAKVMPSNIGNTIFDQQLSSLGLRIAQSGSTYDPINQSPALEEVQYELNRNYSIAPISPATINYTSLSVQEKDTFDRAVLKSDQASRNYQSGPKNVTQSHKNQSGYAERIKGKESHGQDGNHQFIIDGADFVTQEYSSKSKYQGTVANGVRHGQGVLFFEDGGSYNGEWHDGEMNGYGVLFYKEDQVAYAGSWRKGMFDGTGRLHNPTPTVYSRPLDWHDLAKVENYWHYYEGNFSSDKKSGFGKIVFTNGERWEGQFIDDTIHGEGRFFPREGGVVAGHWVSNSFVHPMES